MRATLVQEIKNLSNRTCREGEYNFTTFTIFFLRVIYWGKYLFANEQKLVLSSMKQGLLWFVDWIPCIGGVQVHDGLLNGLVCIYMIDEIPGVGIGFGSKLISSWTLWWNLDSPIYQWFNSIFERSFMHLH